MSIEESSATKASMTEVLSLTANAAVLKGRRDAINVEIEALKAKAAEVEVELTENERKISDVNALLSQQRLLDMMSSVLKKDHWLAVIPAELHDRLMSDPAFKTQRQSLLGDYSLIRVLGIAYFEFVKSDTPGVWVPKRIGKGFVQCKLGVGESVAAVATALPREVKSAEMYESGVRVIVQDCRCALWKATKK